MDWLQTAGSVHNVQARRACRSADLPCLDRAIPELVALLDSLSLFLPLVAESQERVPLTLYLDHTLGLLHCCAVFPKVLEWTNPRGLLFSRLLPDSTRYTASASIVKMPKRTCF